MSQMTTDMYRLAYSQSGPFLVHDCNTTGVTYGAGTAYTSEASCKSNYHTITTTSPPKISYNNSPRPQNHSKVSLDRIFTGWFDSCIAVFIVIFSLLLTVEIYGCNRIKYGKLPAILDFYIIYIHIYMFILWQIGSAPEKRSCHVG
jgi:hypothetical protein